MGKVVEFFSNMDAMAGYKMELGDRSGNVQRAKG
jgi:hypothetical protein